MMSSFLALLKEEPVEGTDMETNNNGRLSMPRTMGHQNSVVNDPQIQGLPISPLASNAMQPPGMIRGDIDPNFEPVTRGRSNTWPLLPEGFMESDDSSIVDPTTSGESQRLQGSTALLEGPGGPPKKNTSRRNPWGNMSYADLIAQAIVSSPEGRATLSQIYDWMVQNVPYFKDKGDSNSSAGWKNSIRHNLSLHNRFMRMQNEGTGKSSWWVLNPDAKPGKSTRRRANTLEGNRMEKKRGRVRKKDGIRNSIEAPSSPSMGEGLEYFPGSPSTGSLHHPFQLSPQDYRPRASSNASSCGRLSPIPSLEADMHDSQVPPVSPLPGWGPDYWPGSNHAMRPHMGAHIHEPYTEHLVESIGEGLKLGPREPWGPPHGMGTHSGSSDCLKIPHHHHHMNGFISQSHSQHPPGYGSYDDYNTFMPPNSQLGGSFPHSQNPHTPKDKINIRRPTLRPFHGPPPLQPISNHNVSPTIVDAQYSSPSIEQDMRLNPSYSTPSHNNTPPTSHLTTSSSQHPLTTSSNQESGPTTTVTTAASSMPAHNHVQTSQHPQETPESTTMLRVALSHRETSSYSINGVPHFKQNGAQQGHSLHTPTGPNDFVDLDNIQGGLDCNVDEIIKHELQYEDHLNFDFHQQQAASFAHSHSYPHRESAGSQIGGPSGPVQVYPYSSIPNGNQWVR